MKFKHNTIISFLKPVFQGFAIIEISIQNKEMQ